VSLFEKKAFFHEKRPKYLVLNLKNFRGALGAAKYPHIPIFLRFISFLFNKFFEKEKIFCLYPFLPKFFFYWNNIRFLFVHLPWYSQIFGEGGGVLPKSPWNEKWNKVFTSAAENSKCSGNLMILRKMFG